MNNHSSANVSASVASDIYKEFINHPLTPFLALLRVNAVGPRNYLLCLESLCKKGLSFFADSVLHAELGLREAIRKEFVILNGDLNNPSSFEKNEVIKGVLQDLKWTKQDNNHILLMSDSAYPQQLRELYDCPPLLFVKGNPAILKMKQLAMVGSRRPTREGSMNARNFAQHLVEQGWVVTSGLASGIDTFSHEGALLAENQSTIAVLAHGLDKVYPKRNQILANRIVESGGALVSEFPIGVEPKPEFFPKRNRIISGLSLGVLVVEAACKSGSLITAYSALEQNRDVFAIPGSIHNPMARGCHELIKHGATLVQTSVDINEHYVWSFADDELTHKAADKKNTLTKEEEKIMFELQHEELTANEIAVLLSLSIQEVSSLLTIMEMKGFITQGQRGFLKNYEGKKPE